MPLFDVVPRERNEDTPAMGTINYEGASLLILAQKIWNRLLTIGAAPWTRVNSNTLILALPVG